MNRFLNKSYKGIKEASNFSLKERIEKSELENHFQNFASCQDVSNESLRLKKMLKQAVKKEFAPQRLIDSIRNQIRR